MSCCRSEELAPLPLSEDKLVCFVAKLGAEGLSASTLRGYLSGLRYQQLSLGMGNAHLASMATLQLVLRGVKRVQVGEGRRPRIRLPITPAVLLRLREAWKDSAYAHDSIMLWAACTVCFFGFLRSGEITVSVTDKWDAAGTLMLEDVALDDRENPRVAKLRIKASKTDQWRTGVDVFLGSTGNRLCPVMALLAYLVVWGSEPGPLFRFASGAYLTRESFVKEVRAALSKAGVVSSEYCGRIGTATTAAALGLEDSLIKALGRWESSAYQLYVKLPRETLVGSSIKLASAEL